MDLAITTPEAVGTNKLNLIGMSFTKAGHGQISAMENMLKKTPSFPIFTFTSGSWGRRNEDA